LRNISSGNIDLYETNGVSLTKINQAGPGNLTLSYSGTLTGEANATVNGGTLTLTNRGPETSAADPVIVETAVNQTANCMNNIDNQVNSLLFIPANGSLASPIYAVRNTNAQTQPYVMDVFSENFNIVWPGRGFEQAYEGLGLTDSFWSGVGFLQY